MAEYYDTYTGIAKDSIAALIAKRHLPFLHLQIDLWSTPVTREDALGVYVTYLDENMNAQAHLLAARHVRPTPELKTKGADLLLMYLEDVAKQYNFDLLQHVFSMTTDAGGNIRRLAEKLLDRRARISAIEQLLAGEIVESDEEDEEGEMGVAAARRAAERKALEDEQAALEELVAVGDKVYWMWCKCHQAHLACVDAAGVDLMDSKRAPTNPEMQKLVLELVDFVNAVNSRTGLKIAYEATLLAEAGRKEKMRTVVKQRWGSLAELLRRVLKNLKAIKSACAGVGVSCPFGNKKAELQEVYSIIAPVANYIQRAQASMARTRRPVIVASHFDLVGLRNGALNKDQPLGLLDAETGAALMEEVEVQVDGEKTNQRRPITREHEQLSAVAQKVRELLAKGFDSRGLKAQYTHVEWYQRSADMAMVLYPPMASLDYICKLGAIYNASPAVVARIKADVKARVVEMLELHIKRERAAKTASVGPTRASACQPRVLKAFQKKATPKASASHYLALGLLPSRPAATTAEGCGRQQRSAAEEAHDIFEKYMKEATALDAEAFCAEYPPDHVNEYWKQRPDGPLKAVARCILGQGASSAPLENVFSTGRDFCSRRRSSLAPHLIEMLLVCALMRRFVSLTPDDVNEIPKEDIQQHLPGRFTREELITDLKAFGDHLMRLAKEAEGEEGEEWEWDDGNMDDRLDLMAPWSSLAEWGVEDLDLDRIDEEELGLGGPLSTGN